jgi:N-acetylglutamate synthase-like GNAT family acetyltransferase
VFEIKFLADAPQYVDQLADWHHAQWQHLYENWTYEIARTELLAHAQCKTLPTTLVLSEKKLLIGSVSLLEIDAEALSHIGSPWLASLYVKPSERGKGCGAELVKAVIEHAKNIAIKKVFLFTPEHKAFYQQLGWQAFEQENLNGQAVDVMSYQVSGSMQ